MTQLTKALSDSGRMLWRHRKVSSVRLLFLSVCLAVLSIATLSIVSEQLKSAMLGSATRFMAGDRQLISPREIPSEWLLKAEETGLQLAKSIEFASMLYAGDDMQLVSVKAVDDEYPLKGELEIDVSDQGRVSVSKGPQTGNVWLQQRLFSLLSLDTKAEVFIGDLDLSAEHTLAQEPDAGFQVFGLAPRVLMNWADVEATGVIQAGSRITWRYYFAGPEAALSQYDAWLEAKLDNAQRWEGVKEGRPAISDALEKTDTYLLLGGSLAVLLACVAIAMAARQFSLEQINQVALLKTLGQQGGAIILHYVLFLMLLAGFGSLVGMGASILLADLITQSIQGWIPELQFSQGNGLGLKVVLLSLGTAFVTLMSFALPEFFQLRHVTPMQVLRQEKLVALAWSWKASLFSLLATFGLLYAYGGNAQLVLLLLLGFVAVIGSIALLVALIYWLFRQANAQITHVGSSFRQAAFNLLRRRWHTMIQLCVFSFALLLLALIWLARDSLISDWQSQLPEDTPNHFLINIDPAALDDVSEVLSQSEITTSGLYPMVRGRLSHINDVPVKVAVTKDVGALNRELNLTWSASLPEDNRLLEGEWWDANNQLEGYKRVSIESELAGKLDVKLGDRLMFNVGGRELPAVITSVRSVEWDSMRPNFYMMFEPDSLDAFPATYITSFFMEESQKAALNKLGRQFPTVSILELDQLVEKVRTMINQVSAMIEVILVFIFVASMLVMSALISTSMPTRVREAALLRTLGAKRGLITRTQFAEFALLAGLAGFLAVVCAEAAMWGLQSRLFGSEFNIHWPIWVVMPIGASLLIGIIAYAQIRHVPNTSPMLILRSGEGES